MRRACPRPDVAALAAVVCLSVTVPSAAQVQYGAIFGRVTDGTGALLPGATVTIEGPALLQRQSVTTMESGGYRFPQVPTGTYTVTFELQGFSKFVHEGVQV